MRFLIFFLLITSCEARRSNDFEVGDCALGGGLALWKLTKIDQGKYLFVAFPVQDGAPIEVVEDTSVLKKIECPK